MRVHELVIEFGGSASSSHSSPRNLSVFQLYGTPPITPVFVGGLIAMLAIVVVGFGSAGVVLARRDIAA